MHFPHLRDCHSKFPFKGINVTRIPNPSKNISREQFLKIKSDWLIKNSNFELIEEYLLNNQNAIKPYKDVVIFLKKNFPNIELNAGHDLNLENLNFILKEIPSIKEVSIGHALVCDAFIFGLERTIEKYLNVTKTNI